MAARANHDEPAIAQPKAGGVLVPVLVGLRLTGKFLLGEMVVHVSLRIAALAVLYPVWHPGLGQHVLQAGAEERAGGEGMTLDNDRLLRQHRLDAQGLLP